MVELSSQMFIWVHLGSSELAWIIVKNICGLGNLAVIFAKESKGYMMGDLYHILVIDDDQLLRTALCENFKMVGGFVLYEAGTATDALAWLRQNRPDLILLDVGLPDMDGRVLCQKIRRNGVTSPIVMLTAASRDHDVIDGLDAGANDYVQKPFRFQILLARIRTHIRYHTQSERQEFEIAGLRFKPISKLLLSPDHKTKIRLTEKEAAILQYLYQEQAKIVSREELLQEIWGYSANITTHTLETHIYRLRRKIEPDPGNARYLRTEIGGYQLTPNGGAHEIAPTPSA